MAKRPKMIQIRIQSISTHDMELNANGGHTVGRQVDAILLGLDDDGCVPNKLVIDFNPPEPPNDSKLDDDLKSKFHDPV